VEHAGPPARPPQFRRLFAPHAQKTCGAAPSGYRRRGENVPSNRAGPAGAADQRL